MTESGEGAPAPADSIQNEESSEQKAPEMGPPKTARSWQSSRAAARRSWLILAEPPVSLLNIQHARHPLRALHTLRTLISVPH
jgi:hypothetical protein